MRANLPQRRKSPGLEQQEWELIDSLFFDAPPGPFGGRPRTPSRDCFEAVWWIRSSGRRWTDLPRHYPSPTTCLRRFREWDQSGVWQLAESKLMRKM